jgi:alpha-amylase
MINWRSKTLDLPISNFVHKESYSAWSKGNRGFFAINASARELKTSFQTSLPAGKYCNILNLRKDETTCQGSEVTVLEDGTIDLDLLPKTAIAILGD